MSALRRLYRKANRPPCVVCGAPTRYKSKEYGFKCYECRRREHEIRRRNKERARGR